MKSQPILFLKESYLNDKTFLTKAPVNEILPNKLIVLDRFAFSTDELNKLIEKDATGLLTNPHTNQLFSIDALKHAYAHPQITGMNSYNLHGVLWLQRVMEIYILIVSQPLIISERLINYLYSAIMAPPARAINGVIAKVTDNNLCRSAETFFKEDLMPLIPERRAVDNAFNKITLVAAASYFFGSITLVLLGLISDILNGEIDLKPSELNATHGALFVGLLINAMLGVATVIQLKNEISERVVKTSEKLDNFSDDVLPRLTM